MGNVIVTTGDRSRGVGSTSLPIPLSGAERSRRFRERHRIPVAPRTCPECGQAFVPKRSDAVVCSDRCKKRRWRRWSS